MIQDWSCFSCGMCFATNQSQSRSPIMINRKSRSIINQNQSPVNMPFQLSYLCYFFDYKVCDIKACKYKLANLKRFYSINKYYIASFYFCYYNHYYCFRCTKCPSRTYLKTPCSKTADSICNCITGFFFKSISNTCEKCKTCPVGEGVVDECSHSSRRTCRSCLEVRDVELSEVQTGLRSRPHNRSLMPAQRPCLSLLSVLLQIEANLCC